MTPKRKVSLRLPDGLLEQIAEAQGGNGRTEFVESALKAALPEPPVPRRTPQPGDFLYISAAERLKRDRSENEW